MKKMLLVLAIISIAAMPALAQDIKLSGSHYNLNVIGFAQCKMTQDGPEYPDCFKGNAGDIPTSGHTIFVPLKTMWIEDPCKTDGATPYEDPQNVQVAELLKGVRILVSDGPEMTVPDRDATDGLARFILPAGSYEVYAKAGGKPGGCMDLDTIICYDFTDTGTTRVDCAADLSNGQYVVVGHVDVDRSTGKAHWQPVTDQMLPEITGTKTPGYYDFFWQIYNNNLRLLQLRFYPVEE